MITFYCVLLLAGMVWLLILWRRTEERLHRLEQQLLLLQRKLSQPATAEGSADPHKTTTPSPTPPSVPRAEAPSLAPVPVLPAVVPPLIPVDQKFPQQSQPPPEVHAPPGGIPAINWEKFLGVNLFAWVGGFALFLGVAFFIKYSFEQGWISPTLRVVAGLATGLSLVIGGLFIPRPRHAVTAQTLCAAGVLILYASLFGAHSLYHLVPAGVAFALMSVVTTAAFLLAGRLQAPVVAILGLAGGFLTPPLLSTGVDRPLALFSYIALLDVGLFAVACRQRWHYLVILAALGTVLMEWAWVWKFFEIAKVFTGLTIFTFFAGLFTAGLFLNRKSREPTDKSLPAGVILTASAGFAFGALLLWDDYAPIARRPLVLYGYIFALDVLLLLATWLRAELRVTQALAGAAVFVHLLIWTSGYLTPALLAPALSCYLVFALLHTLHPLFAQRFLPVKVSPLSLQIYPPLTLVLILIPMVKFDDLSWLAWPVVLILDLLAIVMAVFTASLWAILAVLLLTVAASACWIFQRPPAADEVAGLMLLVGGFAVFFMVAALLVGGRVLAPLKMFSLQGQNRDTDAANTLAPMAWQQLLVSSALMPFLLLALVILRLPLSNPTPVFGLAALLALLLLVGVRFYRTDVVVPVALAAICLLQPLWYFTRFTVDKSSTMLLWCVAFGALFFVYPFAVPWRNSLSKLSWTTSMLAWPAQFWLLHQIVARAYPNDAMGLIPLILAIPCFSAWLWIYKRGEVSAPLRPTLLALYAGVTLFFVTSIFPIQFERQWITLSWALEGTALLALYRRVPHLGLQRLATLLLVAAFVRMALNPAVLSYYPRSGSSIWNWYLYTYGTVVVCLIAAGLLSAPPRDRMDSVRLPPVFYSLATVLSFLLLNIEIANYFSQGNRIRFDFDVSFAQDMAYSLGWASFACVLLGLGFRFRSAATRYAGMGLLVVTLLKLFLHDLWQLGGLYRIGSLIGLAAVLILVSFVYQRFLSPRAARNEGTTAKS